MNLHPEFKLTAEILDNVRTLHAAHATHDEIIWYLFRAGVPKPAVMLALRITGVMGLGEAKEITHEHPAFEFRRANDEAFHESVIDAWDEIEAAERAEVAHTAA